VTESAVDEIGMGSDGLQRCVMMTLALLVAGCGGMPSFTEQEHLVAKGELRLHQLSTRAILSGWGSPTYSVLQHCQFFPLSNGNWVPDFRVKLGEYPKDWDLTTVVGDGLFLAYAERGEMLGFYDDRLVYKERLSPEHIHALGKQWQREARFKTRLEDGRAVR
jgi:hypothetical protein